MAFLGSGPINLKAGNDRIEPFPVIRSASQIGHAVWRSTVRTGPEPSNPIAAPSIVVSPVET